RGGSQTRPRGPSRPPAPARGPGAFPPDPLFPKPKEFPFDPPLAPSLSPPQNGAASSTEYRPPQQPSAGTDNKPANSTDKPASSTAQSETSVKPQPAERETAFPPASARKSAKPATKPPEQAASPARKSEPSAQIAAITPKPLGPDADAALARLTKEIQRAGSQVLPRPVGATESAGDVATQVDVRYAAGGWVRS